jgi:hypothetical protein
MVGFSVARAGLKAMSAAMIAVHVVVDVASLLAGLGRVDM